MEKHVIDFLKTCILEKKMKHEDIAKAIDIKLVVALKIYKKRGKEEALRLYPEYKEIINTIAGGQKIAIHECFCGDIKKGDSYDPEKCDLGCRYPGG